MHDKSCNQNFDSLKYGFIDLTAILINVCIVNFVVKFFICYKRIQGFFWEGKNVTIHGQIHIQYISILGKKVYHLFVF